jgi:hypothetical protein
MGGSVSSHRELARYKLTLEGEVHKFCLNSGLWKQRWLRLLDRDLSYSANIGALVSPRQTKNSTCIDNRFRLVGTDSAALEVVIECINSGGTLQLWKLRFLKNHDFRLWSRKIIEAMRPSWDNPRSINICKVCRFSFTLCSRQHHCRSCGRSVCAGHSSTRMRLPELGYRRTVRVCDDCKRRHDDYTLKRNKSCFSRAKSHVPAIVTELVDLRPLIYRHSSLG